VTSTSRRILLARDHTSRGELAQAVGVHPKMLGRLACREPPIRVIVWLGEPHGDALGDLICQRIEQVIQKGALPRRSGSARASLWHVGHARPKS
jgi:hypothetical protein